MMFFWFSGFIRLIFEISYFFQVSPLKLIIIVKLLALQMNIDFKNQFVQLKINNFANIIYFYFIIEEIWTLVTWASVIEKPLTLPMRIFQLFFKIIKNRYILELSTIILWIFADLIFQTNSWPKKYSLNSKFTLIKFQILK
jgi:hypothetical protein